MECNPSLLTQLLTHVRYALFPQSKIIDERSKEIDVNLEELRRQKAKTMENINKVNQPDVLRSLVISMSRPGNGGHR